MRSMIGFVYSFTLLFVSSAFALASEDQDAICKIVGHFTNAWNQHECKGSGDYYAEDADFVNIFGMAFSGKEEIENRHVKIHETFLKGTFFEVVDMKVREVKPDIAMVQVRWVVSGADRDQMKGVFTHVFVKNNGQWEITSTQNTLMNQP